MTVLRVGQGSQDSQDSYKLAKSLRFRASASAYLSRTPSVAGNRKTWTWRAWVKRGQLGLMQTIFSSYYNGTDTGYFEAIFLANDTLRINGWNTYWRITSQVFRDPSAWYDIMIVLDTTNTVANDRMRLYINGIRCESFSTVNNLEQNAELAINMTTGHRIGATYASTQLYDGYQSEINFIDGQALGPENFGEKLNGVWVPKKYTGTYGTNGFYLPFNDGANLTELCRDRSGNGNDWTASGISLTAGATYDWMDDTPTNNFATLSAIDRVASSDVSNGGLTFNANGGNATYRSVRASIPATSSPSYCEVQIASLGTSTYVGVMTGTTTQRASGTGSIGFAQYPGSIGYRELNGDIYKAGAIILNEATPAVNDILMMAVGGDRKFYMGLNGVWFNSADPAAGTGQIDTLDLNEDWFYAITSSLTLAHNFNFGQRPFAHTPPTGFKALCTKNRPVGGSVTISGSFTGNASSEGPFVWLNGNPGSLTINGNAVTWGTHADKIAGGFKIRTSSSSYNAASTNSYVVTVAGNPFNAPNNAQVNP